MKKNLTNVLKALGFMAIGMTILFLLYQSQNKAFQAQCVTDGISKENCSLIKKLLDDFRQTNPFWIILIVVTTLLSHLARALRWNQLIESLGEKPRVINGLFSVIIGFFANLGIPRIGEIVRATTMAKYENIPTEKLLGTVVVDRIVDMVTFIILVGVTFFLEFETISTKLGELMATNQSKNTAGPSNLWYLLVGLCIIGVALIIFYIKRPENLMVKKVKGLVTGVLEGIATISKLKRPWLFLFYTVAVWFLYYIMLYLCIPAFGPTRHLGMQAALIVFVFGAFGFLVPSPGGMGTYHWLIIQALTLFGIQAADGFSFANIAYFTGQIISNVGFGLLALILLPIVNKNYHPNTNKS